MGSMFKVLDRFFGSPRLPVLVALLCLAAAIYFGERAVESERQKTAVVLEQLLQEMEHAAQRIDAQQ